MGMAGQTTTTTTPTTTNPVYLGGTGTGTGTGGTSTGSTGTTGSTDTGGSTVTGSAGTNSSGYVVKAPTTPGKIEESDLASLKDPAASMTDIDMSGTSPSTATQTNTTNVNAQTQNMAAGANAADQMTKITAEDSPLMRLSRQQGMLSAAKRGLGNSSIAAGAAQAEAVKAALPLAQQNAANEQQQSMANQANQQQAEMTNATEANKASAINATEQNKFQAQYDDEVYKANVSNALEQNKAAMQKYSTDAEVNRTWLAGEISQTMAQIQGQYQELIAVNQSAASMYGSTLDSLASMWANSDVPLAQKNAYTSSTMTFLQNGLQVTASIADMEFRSTMPTAPVLIK